MVDVTLKIDLDDIIDDLDDLVKRQVPFAAFKALNESVFKGSVDVKKAMPYFIQGGPVPFTARGVQYKKAPNKRNLVASIFIPDDQWKYMRWIVDGGVKRWTKSRHGIGQPLYGDKGQRIKFNKYGNIPGRKRKEALWREIMNRGKGTVAVPMKGNLGSGQFIADRVGRGPALWKRMGKGKKLKLLMVFDRQVEYGKGRFPFQKFATKYVTKSFPRNFNRILVDVVNRESKTLRAR